MSTVNHPLSVKSYRYLSKNYRYLLGDPGFFWMKTVARFEQVRALATRGGERVADATSDL